MNGRTQQEQHFADDAFASFYDVAVVRVFRYVMKGTGGDRRVAEDLTQETFMAAVDALRKGLADVMTMPWIMTVARNKLVDYYRRKTREDHKLTLAWSQQSHEEPPTFAIDEVDALAILDDLLPSHRLVLVLRYVDDLPINEVAALIGRSVRATESILVRARHAVERALTRRSLESASPSKSAGEVLDA